MADIGGAPNVTLDARVDVRPHARPAHMLKGLFRPETPDASPATGQPKTKTAKLKDFFWPEYRGIQPIDSVHRSDPHFFSIFTLWLSANMTIAAFSTGTLGPAVYSLSLSPSLAVIGCVNVLSCSIPAVIGLMGPRTGMRQMLLARWAFGYWVVLLPAILNVATMVAFCLLNSIVGGQALVAASRDQNLSLSVGIVIVAVCALFLSVLGYKALHLFERFIWIPVLIAFIILAVCAGVDGGLSHRADLGPASAPDILSFMAIIFGWTITWAPLVSDFNTYMRQDVPRLKVFGYTFFGLYLPCCLIQMLGASVYLGATTNDAWMAGYESDSVGGLIGAVLLSRGLGNFARFLLVIFALGMTANNAPTAYSASLNCQIIIPWSARLPRWLFTIAITAVYLPLALVGKDSYTVALSNFTGLIGYWASIFCAIVLIEHFVYRRNDYSSYDPRDWNIPRRLPPGLAALFASLVGAAGAVIGMDQTWFRGPVAKAINSTFGGDLGFEFALSFTAIAYLFARHLEKVYLEPWWIRDRMDHERETDSAKSQIKS